MIFMEIDNTNIPRLFIAISENRVVAAASGLKDFVIQMKRIESTFKSRPYYRTLFEENDILYFQNQITGKKYILQKIENDRYNPKTKRKPKNN